MNNFLPDLVCAWPLHLDYPLFRQFIQKERKRFNKVIVVFTQMNAGTANYQPFVTDSLAPFKVTIVRSDEPKAGKDWRNVAVNKGLSVSTSPWIYFTEQDFTPLEGFWKEVGDLYKRTDVFGAFQEGRLHPCCIFIKRELLDKTSKDFGAYPDAGLDHFGKLQKQIESKTIMGVIFPRYWKHLNGLSQNMYMLQKGETPNYNPSEFREYTRACLDSKIPMPADLQELFKKYLGGD